DGERRGLFRMEGAAGAVVGAGLLERHVALDDVDDVDAIQQLLDKAVRNHALTPSALQASAALTSLETSPMSARPATCGLTRAMTLPMSAGPAAPLCATATLMMA